MYPDIRCRGFKPLADSPPFNGEVKHMEASLRRKDSFWPFLSGYSRVTRFPVVFRAHGRPLAPFDGRLATRILAEDAYFLAMKPVGRFLGCRHPAVQR